MAGSLGLNTSVAHEARVYDYWLGGKDNYAADRDLGDAMTEAIPRLPLMARANRAFMHRLVRHVVAEGVTQFLDIGTGIPTSPNLHEVAQSLVPSSRVVYVDNDPLVLAHARALMTSDPAGATAYVHADLTDPDSILADPLLEQTLDLAEPVALTLVAVLMYFTDEQRPERWVARLADALAPGSLIAVSHPTGDFDPPAVEAAVRAARAAGITLVCRDRAGFEALFGGATLLEPGVVPLAAWRPDTPPDDPRGTYYYAGLARKD
ncbi:SAM-dependent methyltransferase [Actinomadura chibensis]|nr:SAM-dependent methyltransferase [Actinomadura chibensis]